MRRCPTCAEEIQGEAATVTCRYRGSPLPPETPINVGAAPQRDMWGGAGDQTNRRLADTWAVLGWVALITFMVVLGSIALMFVSCGADPYNLP